MCIRDRYETLCGDDLSECRSAFQALMWTRYDKELWTKTDEVPAVQRRQRDYERRTKILIQSYSIENYKRRKIQGSGDDDDEGDEDDPAQRKPYFPLLRTGRVFGGKRMLFLHVVPIKSKSESSSLTYSEVEWMNKSAPVPEGRHGADVQVVRSRPEPHEAHEGAIMACPEAECGMLVVQCRKYECDDEKKCDYLEGKLWSIDDRDLLHPDRAECFRLDVHDEGEDNWNWQKSQVHLYKCKGCRKKMALVAVDRLVPPEFKCIIRYNAVVNIGHYDVRGWMMRTAEQRKQGKEGKKLRPDQ